MARTLMAAWWAAAALAGGTAAETFHDKDGIRFEGTIRLALSDAAVCNVLEANEIPEAYERMKANQGRPLHVWRVDLSVRNGSGRELDFLRADSWVLSEWPPCTNWDGPSASALEPFIRVQWADTLEVVSMSYGMRRGQQVRRALYVLAFDGHEPRFGEWDIRYTFSNGEGATESPAGPAGAGRAGGAGPPSGQLPPEIQADLHLRKAEQAARAGDAATARGAMERVASLQATHGLDAAPEDHYRHARAWAAAGEAERAVDAAVRYLQSGGRDAEHYTEALDLINRDGAMEAGPAAGPAAAGRAGPGTPSVPPPVAAEPRAGESRDFDGMAFAWVPAGDFLMGSTSSEADDDESPVTRVRISRGFWLGRHEVTQDQWQAVMGTNPSRFSGCGSCPVESVSWEDAQAFIRQLNGRGGGSRYRLSTEAEWEHAARAGTSGDRYAANLDSIAWCGEGFRGRTHPVGQKVPNAWGLHDMLGNVWEWVQDWHGAYPGGTVTDPAGPSSGSSRVIRGGSWGIDARYCRASDRSYYSPGFRVILLGFRLLRSGP